MVLFDIYKRWIPQDGIEIYPDIKYLDINDVSIDERKRTREFFHEDKEYKELKRRNIFVRKGGVVNRRIGAYVYKENESIGTIIGWEVMNNPDGYSDGDFSYSKLIYPKFRHTKYSRYASADFMHMAFVSELVNRFYIYVPATNSDSDFFYDVMDLDNIPCAGERFLSDGLKVQKYISIKKRIDTVVGPVVLIEFDGNIYRNMDLKEYMHMVPGRSTEIVDRWLSEMNDAAKRVINA